ncbi:hypothetical protein ACFOTA_06825 [Chitinophaga sp. GCM10012297]|uniref:HTH cro/C1-type domain-containing protein n=1 Tax=Chitinophaga chungangae TaxID=2821488 RepID=A0ABS3YB58_9BACT|nr:hypothetical protein [Chitinophaga chungangae]MBO9151912.1 hypothetical protein [Chitinophaga chungangae]
MKLKKEYQELVNSVRKLYLNKGKRLKNEDFAARLGYNKSYFGTLVGTSGKVTADHIAEFTAAFKDELTGIEKPPASSGSMDDRSIIKALLFEVAQLKSEKEGISFDEAVAAIRKNTNLVKTLDFEF